jgi:hypothetical protein
VSTAVADARKKCLESFYKFNHYVMGYPDIDTAFHRELCATRQSWRYHPITLHLEPRGHLKTSILTIGDSCYEICLNPNPSPNSGLGAQQNGQVAVPFGQQPATNNEGALANVIAQLSAPLEEDPNSTTYRAADNWESQSNVLGDMIAKSIGCGEGSANDDQRAAASGIEEDIEQGRLDGAPWIESLTAVTITGTEGGTGNLEFDLALARNAHECGAKLAPATRAFLGLPPEPEDVATGGPLCGTPPGAAGANLGAAPGALVVAPAGGAVGANDPSKAANVGGANSVQLMKVYDLGLIYPICDHTPILWMQ